MSMEVATDLASLGQFASNKGYMDLIEAVEEKEEDYPVLVEWFRTGETSSVAKARKELEDLAGGADPEVATTARELSKKIVGQEIAVITDGTMADELAEKRSREYTKEYLDAVLAKVKQHLPEWLYKELHRIAMSSAGGRAKARRMRELVEQDLEKHGNSLGKLDLFADLFDEGDSPMSTSLEISLQGDITKVDSAKHLVFGWASVIEKDGEPVVDKQGDVIDEDELEDAAYAYVLESRKAGEMHKRVGIGKLVESIAFTKQKQQALGVDLGMVGWWVGFKVSDEAVWKKVEDGTYKSFSIHGRGRRQLLEQ